MNEDFLKALYTGEGFDKHVDYAKFKSDMMTMPAFRKQLHEDRLKDKVSFDQFEKDLAIPQQGIEPLQKYQKGPVGVARPGVMANPGIDDQRLKDYYSAGNPRQELEKAALTPGPARDNFKPTQAVQESMKEVGKLQGSEEEAKAAALLNSEGDVLTTAKSMYGTEFDKKKEKYSKDPQIADAEFSFEALNIYKENAKLVSDRSRERLKLLNADKYKPADIDKVVSTYTALTMLGKVDEANAYIEKYPELKGDVNLNNIVSANDKLRETSLAEMHVLKNNPAWLKRQDKIRDTGVATDATVAALRTAPDAIGDPLEFGLNAMASIKARTGTWIKNLAVTPGMRDFGRDMMDFNPKSSDFAGRAIENYKKVKGYDVVYDGDKISYVRDSRTGFIVKPEAEQMKALKAEAEGTELQKRFNPKPFVGQTADVMLDMAPIIAMTAATGGTLGGVMGMNAARGLGVVLGSALQTRGDIMDQMLLHPDISNTEAEMYTLAIGTGIGLISLINPIESRILSKGIPGILKGNTAKLLNKEITKGQLAWNITKDIAHLVTAEPFEETAQDWFQYGAMKGLDSAKDGYGRFGNNETPTGDTMLETALVSAAVGIIGGAGDIRKSRNEFIDSALDHALSNPKVMNTFLEDMTTGAETIQDPDQKQAALDHIDRIRGRWDSIQANVNSIKGLDSRKRGKLAGLIADSNALEAEAQGITNSTLLAVKKEEIKAVNDEIKALITPGAVTATTQANPDAVTPEITTPTEDRARMAASSSSRLSDQEVQVSPDYFEPDQRIEDENGTGTITGVHKNADGSVHAVDIEYDGGDTRRANVFRKTPMETGIKVLSEKKGEAPYVDALKDVESTAKALADKLPTGPNGLQLELSDGIILHQDLVAKKYHEAKADGSNPELVAAVEKLLGAKAKPAEPAKPKDSGKPVVAGRTPKVGDTLTSDSDQKYTVKGFTPDGRVQFESSAGGRGVWSNEKFAEYIEGGRLKYDKPDEATPAEPAKTEPTTKASIPVMITNKMEADLRAKGHTQEQIDKMTPQEANDILNAPPETKDGKKYTSAVAAFGESKDGDKFRLTVTNPNPKSHHGGTKGNTFTSQEILVRQGDVFIPEDDLGLSASKQRRYDPKDLDKNNKELSITKLELPEAPPAEEDTDTEDVALSKEIDKETAKVTKARDEALAEVANMVKLDPEFDDTKDKARIERTYQKSLKQAELKAKITLINRQRNAETRKAEAFGKKNNRDVTGTIQRLNIKYDDQIAELKKSSNLDSDEDNKGQGETPGQGRDAEGNAKRSAKNKLRPKGRAKSAKGAFKKGSVAERAREALKVSVGNNPVAMAMQYLLENKINSAVIRSMYGGMLRNGDQRKINGEVAVRLSITDNSAKAKTIAELGDEIWQYFGMPEDITDQELAGAVESVLQDYNSRSKIAEALLTQFAEPDADAEMKWLLEHADPDSELAAAYAINFLDTLTDEEILALANDELDFENSPAYQEMFLGTDAVAIEENSDIEKQLRDAFADIYRRDRQALDDGFAEFQGQGQAIINAGGQNLHAHGMGKSTIASALNDLLSLFRNGIDKSRGAGKLYTAPLGAGGSGTGTASGAYANGPFILLSSTPEISDISQIEGILVNDGLTNLHPEILDLLRQMFPGLAIDTYSNVADVVTSINGADNSSEQEKKPIPTKSGKMPNQNGVYDKEDAKVIEMPSKNKNGERAKVFVLQLSDGTWISAHYYQDNITGSTAPLKATTTFDTENEAIVDGARHILKNPGEKAKKWAEGLVDFYSDGQDAEQSPQNEDESTPFYGFPSEAAFLRYNGVEKSLYDKLKEKYPDEVLTLEEINDLHAWEKGRIIRGEHEQISSLNIGKGDIIRNGATGETFTVEPISSAAAKEILNKRKHHFDKDKQYYAIKNTETRKTDIDSDSYSYQVISRAGKPSRVSKNNTKGLTGKEDNERTGKLELQIEDQSVLFPAEYKAAQEAFPYQDGDERGGDLDAQIISRRYYDSKDDGINPEFIAAVDNLVNAKDNTAKQKELNDKLRDAFSEELEKRLYPDDDVIFTNKVGQEMEANFRGYTNGNKAVIVIKGSGQLEVDVDQIRPKLTTDKLTDAERNNLMKKIEWDKTKYHGKGVDPNTISDDELRDLYNKFHNWDRLTPAEKQHFNKMYIASLSEKEWIDKEYGGDDKQTIFRLKKEHQDAVMYALGNNPPLEMVQREYKEAKAEGRDTDLIEIYESVFGPANNETLYTFNQQGDIQKVTIIKRGDTTSQVKTETGGRTVRTNTELFGTEKEAQARLDKMNELEAEEAQKLPPEDPSALPDFDTAEAVPATVRELVNLDAAEQNGYVSGLLLSSVKVDQTFKVGERTYTVAKITKPMKAYYDHDSNGKNFKGSYTKRGVTIKDDKGNTYSYELWDDWILNGDKMMPGIRRRGDTRSKDPVGQLSRDIDGDISVDLINEKNRFHTPSDSYRLVQEALDRLNSEAPAPPPSAPTKAAKRKVRDEKLDAENEEDFALLKKQLKNPNKLTIGGIDPEAVATATRIVSRYVKKGVYKFSDMIEDLYAKMGEDIAEFFEALKSAYGSYINTQATDEEGDQMDQNIRKFTYESLTSKFNQDVSDQPGDSQQDSPGREDRAPGNKGDIRSGNGRQGRILGDENQGTDNSQNKQPQNRKGPSGLLTPPMGQQADLFLHPEVQKSEFEANSTGDTNGRGTSNTGSKGPESDGDGSASVDPGTKAELGSWAERKRLALIQQKKVEGVEVIPMDEDNIRETLPMLLAPQQEDVIKAEKRFYGEEHKTEAKANGKGFMFTNGTGSGKTYTALGIAKRFEKLGKKNILIVTPSQAKVTDWVEQEAPNLLIKAHAIADTKDPGVGLSVTTFANFRANEALLAKDWDLIIYDESHRIMEAKDGKESSITDVHRMMGNMNERQAVERLQKVHPLWKREAVLNQEMGAVIGSKKLTYSEKQAEIRRIDDLLSPIHAEQARLRPAMLARARAAVENTKVVFLSASPFKEHKNLEYANGFLFDYGNETITNARGSRIDARSRFYLDNFGSAWQWKNHRLTVQDKINPDAVAMQEVEFSEKLRTEGVLSGSPIDSEKDYSREFPLVAGFNSEDFNKAFNDIFNYENGKYALLRDAGIKVFFNYQYTVPLFESLKASMTIDRIKKHIDLDRKVVVFHRRREGNVYPPFASVYETAIVTAKTALDDPNTSNTDKEKAALRIDQAEAFKRQYAALFEYEQTLDYRPATQQFEDAFPGGVGYINGSESKKNKNQAIKDFNTDNSRIKLLIVQEEAGKEGISLHDTSGKHQRVLINLSMPISTTTALQIEGRIYRLGQESDAIFEYPLLGLDLEIAHFGQNLNRRLSTTENLAMGEQSRDLIRSFAEGVLFHSSTDDPSETQGQGGKEYDKKVASQQSEFQKAKNVYSTNQKVSGRRDQREGVDYYATPEPLGQKMVEWADVREGDDVLEPSAGHGAIAMWFPIHSTATSIEPSYKLFSKLQGRSAGGTRKVLNQQFEDHNIVNKYDTIVMNPPFGSGGKMAMDHVEKAFKHLREGGRIVALVPVGGMDKRVDNFLYGEDEKGRLINPDAHMVKEILLPSVTFDQAGTKINTRIIIIDKVGPKGEKPNDEGTLDLRDNKTIGDFFDALEFVEMPPRTMPKKEMARYEEQEDNSYNAPAPVKQGGLMAPVTEFRHTKTNALLFSVKMTQRVPTDVYYQFANKAKTMNGEYSRFTKTFLFTDKASAEKFRDEVNGGPQQNSPSFSMDSAPTVMPDLVNGFYSPLEKIIAGSKADKLPVKQWLEKFARGEEAKWTGLTDWLSDQEGSISKSDILDFLENNRVEIKEVVKSDEPFLNEQTISEKKEDVQTELRSLGYEMSFDMGGDIYLTKKGEDEPIEDEEEINNLPDRVRSLGMEYARLNELNDDEGPDSTQYGGYTLPGEKTKYKEVLVTLPNKEIDPEVAGKRYYQHFIRKGGEPSWEDLSDQERSSITVSVPSFGRKEDTKFQSNHWSEPNILVHLRMDTRIDANGDKVLFLEEVQSDWAQKGRRDGFKQAETSIKVRDIPNVEVEVDDFFDSVSISSKDPNSNISRSLGRVTNLSKNKYEAVQHTEAGIEKKLGEYKTKNEATEALLNSEIFKSADKNISSNVQPAPFVTDTNAWTKLALKVATKEAVKQGATKIAWTTGEQQADRFNLSQQVKKIVAFKPTGFDKQIDPEFPVRVTIYPKTGPTIKLLVNKQGKVIDAGGSDFYGQQLEDIVGKEMSERIMAVSDSADHEFSGDGLKVGDHGMTGYYGDPAKGKLGILGGVAKSLFLDVNTSEVDIAKVPKERRYQVLIDDEPYVHYDTKIEADNKVRMLGFSGMNARAEDTHKPIMAQQHSVTITPELANQVKSQGLPLFSIQAAEDAVKSGNPDPNAPIVISLRDAGATVEENLRQFADVWIDLVEKQSQAFINRGLELIKGTEYDTGNPRGDLANAIADKAAKSKKDNKLINWVKAFWTRVGKIMKINVTPQQLEEMKVGEYLDIAATQMIFGNEIYMDLLADEARQATDTEPVITPSVATPESIASKYDVEADEAIAIKPLTSGKPVPAPAVSFEAKYEYEGRDTEAKGTVLANPRGPAMVNMLETYSGAKRRVLETLVLLFPTLKAAGIKITIHESKDSYANAVTENGGTVYQATNSGGFYHNKEAHINLSKPNLKENTALHEAFHPVIRELLVKDQPAFKRFIAEILADPEMRRRYVDEFAQNYKYLAGQENAIEEEILVEASADIVMKRILRDMKDIPDKLFDRILQYIKDVLGDVYGQLAQFINTKEKFADFANSLADAISKGMVVPMDPEINDNLRTIVNDSIQHSKQKNAPPGMFDLFGAPQAAQTDLFGLMNNQVTGAQPKATPEALLRQKYFDLGYPAPNGKPSNLTPEQYAQVRTPEFKAWFGDSKVVDENGDPLPVWHGTDANFKIFGENGANTFFFTEDSVLAKTYGKSSIQAFLNISNPASGEDVKNAATEAGIDEESVDVEYPGVLINMDGRVRDILTKKGFDGWIGMDSSADVTDMDEAMTYVAFSPTQIKSATDNTGAFDPNNPDIRFSSHEDYAAKVARIKKDLEYDILTNPHINFEPIVGNLINKGILTKEDGDELLKTKRAAKEMGFGPDAMLNMLRNMAGLQHLHRMDEKDNLQVKNANMQQFINDLSDKRNQGILDTLLDRYTPGTIKEWVEEVTASGKAHPAEVIEKYREFNANRDPVGVPTIIATSIAFAELKREATFYKTLVDDTGDVEASKALQAVQYAQYELARLAKMNGSLAGATLGIRSKLLQLAGLTYESEMAQLEEINESEAGIKAEIDQETKDEMKRLVDRINTLQTEMDNIILAGNSVKTKKSDAAKEYTRMTSSSLESRPIMTKEEALEHLRRLRGIRASFSLMLSADPPEFNVYDIINQLVKIAHQEGASGYQEAVAKVMEYEPTLTEQQIYEAILSTTPMARQKALSEYAKRQAMTRKQVKDIAKVEKMVKDQILDLLRTKKMPDESQMADFGRLLKDIEKGIYLLDPNSELYTRWLNALELIRTNYGLAFLNPDPTKDTDQMLGEIINAVQILKDQKFYEWIKAEEEKLQEQKRLIEEGRISELIQQDDLTQRKYPMTVTLPVYEDGELVGTEEVDFDFGQADREIRDAKKEIERLKNKFRKQNPYTNAYKITRGTLGTAQAMADLSMIAIQGYKAAITTGFRNPRLLKKAFVDSLKAFADEFNKKPGFANQAHYNITQDSHYAISQQIGLDVTAADSHHFINEMLSEDDAFDIAYDKTKGRKNKAAKAARAGLGFRKKVKMASNAAFATYLNTLSMGTFSAYVEKVKTATGAMPSIQEMTVIAHEINSSTGRSKRISGATKGLAYVFWAPKLYLSQILNMANIIGDPVNLAANMIKAQVASAKGDTKSEEKARELIRAYGYRTVNSAIFAGTAAAIYMLRVLLAKWQCGDNASVNTDIAKPSFLKIQCGELTLDPTGNHRQWLALGARLLAAAKDEPYLDYMGRPVHAREQFMDLFQYKFNPVAATTFEFIGGTDFLGRQILPGDESDLVWFKRRGLVLLQHVTPIAAGNVVDIAATKGMDGSMPTIASKPLVMAEAILGFGVTRIDEEKENERKALEKEARDKKKAAKQTEDVGQLRTRIGNLKELEGQFVSAIPAESLTLTEHTVSYDGKTYKVFKRSDDPGGNKKDDDYFTVKTTKTGPNKGKKYFDRVEADKVKKFK